MHRNASQHVGVTADAGAPFAACLPSEQMRQQQEHGKKTWSGSVYEPSSADDSERVQTSRGGSEGECCCHRCRIKYNITHTVVSMTSVCPGVCREVAAMQVCMQGTAVMPCDEAACADGGGAPRSRRTAREKDKDKRKRKRALQAVPHLFQGMFCTQRCAVLTPVIPIRDGMLYFSVWPLHKWYA